MGLPIKRSISSVEHLYRRAKSRVIDEDGLDVSNHLDSEEAEKIAREMLSNASIAAAAELIAELDHPMAKIRQRAAIEILDRSMGRPGTAALLAARAARSNAPTLEQLLTQVMSERETAAADPDPMPSRFR